MNHFFFFVVLLPLSLTIAVNFTQVFEWQNGFDYEWPSEANRTQALKDGTFKASNVSPRYMAVHGSRIFLSLQKKMGVPVTLVSLPTSSASSASPKLTPFPSWDKHGNGDCNKIYEAKGQEVDSIGRLWVLDSGSNKSNCNAKLWIFDLNKNTTDLAHQFPFRGWMHDLVLEETSNGTFAYISRWKERHIVVFSLEKNTSWIVNTPGIEVFSIALSPKEKPRQLYICKFNSTELYSISVAELRNGTRTENPELIGKWTARPYRMLMDNHGTMYAAFWEKNYTSSWKTTQLFQEQRFLEVGERNIRWPFTFALDSSGTFWITEHNKTGSKSRRRLLKVAPTPGGRFAGKRLVENFTLIGSLAFFLVLSCIIILWLSLRMKKQQNSNEQRNAGAEEMELPTVPNPASTEMVHEEIENDMYGVLSAPPPRPRL